MQICIANHPQQENSFLGKLHYKGDVLLEFSSVKWVLNEDHTLYCNLLGTLLLQNFVLVNSYFIDFFVGWTTVEIEGMQKNWH